MNKKIKKIYGVYFILALFLAFASFYYGKGFVRNYLCDVFSAMYLYFGLRLFFSISIMRSFALSICIAYGIELYQLTDFDFHEQSYLYSFFLGGTADLADIIAYNIGIGGALLLEFLHRKKLTE